MARKTEDEIKALVDHELSQAINNDKSGNSDRRVRAINYMQGIMNDTPARKNRSAAISNDTHDIIGWMLPGIIRALTASGRIVEYEPQNKDDEEGAKQASDYVTHQFMQRNDGYRIIYHATYDSLLHGNGIVKHWWDESVEEKVSLHSGLTDLQLARLLDDDEVEVIEHAAEVSYASPEEDEAMNAAEGAPPEAPMTEEVLHTVKIKRTCTKGRLRLQVIPRERFLINTGATEIANARFCAHWEKVMLSDLIEMGFPRSKVEELGVETDIDDTEEGTARAGGIDGYIDYDSSGEDATMEVDLFECYAKIDVDGDGVAETVRIYMAGQGGAGTLLDWEEWEDEMPFSDIPCEPVPHRFDAIAAADHTMDVQQIKTAIVRAIQDNLYAHNNPRPIYSQGAIVNTQAMMNPRFGEPIIFKSGTQPMIEWYETPFVGDAALKILEYWDMVLERRTGVSKMTMALDPEALQNQTATAVQKGQDAAYSKIELIARNQAELGWKNVFKACLRLITRHQNKTDVIRLRNDWVEMDPTDWNADMDATVNVGLGTGSRDRDMAMLNVLLQGQIGFAERLAQAGMSTKAVEFLTYIRDTMVKQGEAAGLRNADDYFPQFTPEEIQQAQQLAMQAAQQGDPKLLIDKEKNQIERDRLEFEKQNATNQTQAEIQKAKIEATLKSQIEKDKLQANIAKENAQAQADIAVEQQRMRNEIMIKREELRGKFMLERMKIEAQKEVGLAQARSQKRTLQKKNADGSTTQTTEVGGA